MSVLILPYLAQTSGNSGSCPTEFDSSVKTGHTPYTNGRTSSSEETSPVTTKSPVSARAGRPSPVVKEVHIETIDRERSIAQLTPTAIVSPGMGPQFAWRSLQPNGQLILMPTPPQSLVAHTDQLKLHRPPAPSLRRSSAIDKEDEADGGLNSINLERVHGPFVAEPSLPAGEGLNDMGEIKLVHKWMERKEKHRLSHQGSSLQSNDQSFDEDQKTPKSSSPQTSPASTSPKATHQSPITSLPPLTSMIGSSAMPTPVTAQPPTATFPMTIPNTTAFMSPTFAHSQPPLLYAPGVQGTVIVANPYQQWPQQLLPGYMLPMAPTPGTPVMTTANPSQRQQQTGRVARDQPHMQASRPSSGSPLYKQPKQEPDLAPSGLKRSSRLSSSLPDISQVSNSKKPKHSEPLRGVPNTRVGSGSGIDHHRMIHSSSLPEYSRSRVPPLQPRKQMSEDTELAEITGGPLYMFPVNQEGNKLPPCKCVEERVCV